MRLNLFITQETLYEKAIQRDLILRAKNENIISCYFYDADDALIDITGSEIYFMVKDNPSQADADAKLNKKITSLTDPTNGNAEIELTATETASLLGNYIFQIKIKFDSNFYTVAEGNICFMQSIITRES
jgi:hypothetical protein